MTERWMVKGIFDELDERFEELVMYLNGLENSPFGNRPFCTARGTGLLELSILQELEPEGRVKQYNQYCSVSQGSTALIIDVTIFMERNIKKMHIQPLWNQERGEYELLTHLNGEASTASRDELWPVVWKFVKPAFPKI